MRFCLYDLVVEGEGPRPLFRECAGRGERDDSGEGIWELRFCPVRIPEVPPIHDVLDFDGQTRLEVFWPQGGAIYLRYGETRVRWSSAEGLIEYEQDAEEGADDEEAAVRVDVFLERVAAPIALFLERPQLVALHAGAMAAPSGRAYAFLGSSGAGKSTAALQLLRQGWELLADDLVLLDTETLEILPGSSTLRLFDGPDEVDEAVESQYFERFGKYLHRFPTGEDRGGRRALASLCYLEKREEGPATAEEVRGWESARRLLEQGFDLSDGPQGWKARRFQAICSLSRRARLVVIAFSHGRGGPGELPAQVERILALEASFAEERQG